jgi:hypothetical protein
MTSWQSLLVCTQADATIDRITSLTATTGTEPLTVDFKEKASPQLAECVASMANSYGGLVLVGITDSDCEIVGVKAEILSHVADMLVTRLDPADWLPEMFEVPLGVDHPGRYVLVIRIRPELAPRPVMVQRTGPGGDGIFWIPVRIPGGTRQATRAEMAALFASQPSAYTAQGGTWHIDAPTIPSRPDGTPDPAIDMMFETGLIVTPGPACPGRPLSEAAVVRLATALDTSPLVNTLLDLTGLPASVGRKRLAALHGTQRRGWPTARSRTRNRNSAARSPRSISRFRACCTVQAPSGLAVTPRTCTWRVPTSTTKNTYTRRKVTAQSTWKKSQASIVAAWVRRNWRQVVRLRCGAGGIRSRFRIRRAVEALTRYPRPGSSPWIRLYPQPGFSRAICSISIATLTSAAGRPPRCG